MRLFQDFYIDDDPDIDGISFCKGYETGRLVGYFSIGVGGAMVIRKSNLDRAKRIAADQGFELWQSTDEAPSDLGKMLDSEMSGAELAPEMVLVQWKPFK